MHKLKSIRLAFILLPIIVGLIWSGRFPASQAQGGNIFSSPLATPTSPGQGGNPFGTFPPPSTPTPTAIPSTEGQQALQYVAGRYKISITDLIVVNEHRRDYPLTKQTFQAFTLLERKTNRVFKLMIDLNNQTVVEDVALIEQAENEANQVKYGKLEPMLYERLQEIKNDEMVKVAIWVAGKPKKSQKNRYATLAAKYPEAQAALARSGKPMDVGDYDLINEIEAEYVRLLDADIQEQIRPLVYNLENNGYPVTTFGALPVVTVILPKYAIQEITSRIDVGTVYLNEEKEILLLDSASPSNRVSSVWQSGFKGNGINIGILEGNKVDFTGPVGHNYLNQGAVRPGCTGGDSWHKTLVSSCAASYHPTYMGIAPEATIVDVCTDGTGTDTINGLAWAVNQADPINRSAVFNYDANLHWTDRAFDHWARIGFDTVVAGAGNDPNGYIGSPAKGWNVITVGGSNDNNSSIWSDDTMYGNSTWKNPASTHSDREKPEVVAPAVDITGVELNNNTTTENGTSLAAPQVAGLAALLMNRSSDLAAWPEAVKAIIMASAVNNVDGPSGIPTGQDLKDGAGGIDAALADTIAKTRQTSATSPCGVPCWWGVSIDNTNFPDDTYLYRYFQVSQGERVRVAISWWSNADCPSETNCNYDRLDTDLRMGAQYFENGAWQWVSGAWSASWDNNYELVEFTAPKTGQYRIAVYKERADENSNYLGIAWTKQATYLPDVKANWDGWQSTIYVRNDGATETTPTITFYDTAGTSYGPYNPSSPINPNGVWEFPLTSGQFNGSAIVSGSEDVSVVVRNVGSSKAYAYTGMAPVGGSGNPGWGQVGAEVHLPLVMRGHSSWYSHLVVQNPNSAQANVTIHFENYGSRSYTIAPGGVLYLDNLYFLSTPYLGSARITSDQPVAAIASHWKDTSSVHVAYAHNAFSSGSASNHLPLVFRRYNPTSNSGWCTGVNARNLSSSASAVTLTYRPTNLGGVYNSVQTISGNDGGTFWLPGLSGFPDGSYGAASLASNPEVSLVSVANTTKYVSDIALSYNGSLGSDGTAAINVPLVIRNDGGWNTGVQVHNVGSQATNVRIKYYTSSGSYQCQNGPYSVNSGEGHNFYQPSSCLPNGFTGSAVVTASSGGRIVAQVNAMNYGNSYAFSYNGLNR